MSGPWTADVSVANFEAEIVSRSLQVPVLVDFWAPWCGPCKTLGPILEKVVDDLGGAVRLAKIDTDQNPELAQAFRVQGIPAVFLIHQGRPVDGFTGVRSEAEVRQLLARWVTAGPGGALEDALEQERAGDRAGAIEALRAHLRAATDDGAARIELARMLAEDGRVPEARKVFERLSEADAASDAARTVRALLDLDEHKADVERLAAEVAADPDDLAKRIAYGRALVAARRWDEGLEQLFTAAQRDLAFDDGAARKALIEVFEALGDDDPRVREYRQRLSILICS